MSEARCVSELSRCSGHEQFASRCPAASQLLRSSSFVASVARRQPSACQVAVQLDFEKMPQHENYANIFVLNSV